MRLPPSTVPPHASHPIHYTRDWQTIQVLPVERHVEGLDGVDDGGDGDVIAKSQRNAFLRELEAMTRLRSPHTVNVYGAVTTREDRLVLVMELLAGGDLRALLRNAENPLPEDQTRRITGDVCAGMAFLHSKATVHGDLKSANVLFDGAGRAKVGRMCDTQMLACSSWAKRRPVPAVDVSPPPGGNFEQAEAYSIERPAYVFPFCAASLH